MKNPDAVALGRLGGLKGGRARAEKLTPEQRSAIAQKAAHARWDNLTPEERSQQAKARRVYRWAVASDMLEVGDSLWWDDAWWEVVDTKPADPGRVCFVISAGGEDREVTMAVDVEVFIAGSFDLG